MFNNQITVNNRTIGKNSSVFIIAEAGLSHFGELEKAFKLVDLAVQSGADAIKFQIYNIKELFSKESADWINRLKTRTLPHSAFIRIKEYCDIKKIIFFATAHDKSSLDFLIDLKVPIIKIGSGEVGNLSYYEKAAKFEQPIIFSTGMFTLAQIIDVINIFKKNKKKDIAMLHCVTDYPAKYDDISLNNINFLAKKFKIITGYSDHTKGYHIPLAAVALGAKIIEKHITLDYFVPNAQDWKVSCGPSNFKKFVTQVRDIEKTLSIRQSGPTCNEKKNISWAKKSLVTLKALEKGHVIKLSDLIEKRPGTGICPSNINNVIGKKVIRYIPKDSLLSLKDLI